MLACCRAAGAFPSYFNAPHPEMVHDEFVGVAEVAKDIGLNVACVAGTAVSSCKEDFIGI